MKIWNTTWILLIAASIFVGTLIISCKKENVEEKFYGGSIAARTFFQNKLLPVLETKCYSCHNYHTTSANRYDTYSKAAGVAEEMKNRVHGVGGIMPPVSASPLTTDEQKLFEDFYQLVKGNITDTDYKVSIFWTAYKFQDSVERGSVTGTFNDVFINYKNTDAATIYEYLSGAEAIINSSSVNVGNDNLKNSNLRDHFFTYFSPVIYCKVKEISESQSKAVLSVTMNGISKDIDFQIKEDGVNLIFTGSIDNINFFNATTALDSLDVVCGAYHEYKVWPDIQLRAEVRNYVNFKGSN